MTYGIMLHSFKTLFRHSKLYQHSNEFTVLKNCCSFVHNSHQERFHHHNKSKKKNVLWTSSALLSVGTFGALYYLYKKNSDVFPTVYASTSKRKQFNFIADVVEQSVSALVNIEVIDSRRVDFFTGKSITESNGSGFIVREDGLIITNAHVVMHSNTKLKVKLYDGSTYDGVVEDVDMKADLATVRIRAGKKLPTMKLGSSLDARVGEWVIAMGNPLALSNTITTGVISTVERKSKDLKLYGKDMQYLQTDAMITFGNSGGPLVNLDGEVIGINAMKVSTGISFAIPVEYAKEFLKLSDERKKGISSSPAVTNQRRYIGITMLTLTPDLVKNLMQKENAIPPGVTSGVLVWKVMIGSPAFSAGLQPGDIVTHVNGEEVTGASSVYKIIESGGRELEMTIYRRAKKLLITVIPETF